MKQLFKYTTLLLLIFVGVGFASCSDDDDNGTGNGQPMEENIVGTWRADYGEGGYQIVTLEANGMGSIFDVDYVDGQVYPSTEYIIWSYSNGILKLEYEDGDVKTFAVSISGNKMTTTDKHGERTVYTRQGGSSVSPGGDGNTNTAFYIGTWYWSEEGYYEEITFRSNGTGTYAWYDNEGDSGSESFTYTYSGGMMRITIGGSTVNLSVESVSQNKIRIDGDIYIRK